MPVQLQEYPDMVDRLGKGGFDADQSAALIQLVGRLFTDQNEHIERVLRELRLEHEKTRAESRRQFELLDGKIERNWRWTIATLTAISVSLISALTLLLLRTIA